ncbi:MAG: hypothetical protein F8N35_10435 [Paludibacter sp.]|nr:hypothetical protein [Paludibacter sp.]
MLKALVAHAAGAFSLPANLFHGRSFQLPTYHYITASTLSYSIFRNKIRIIRPTLEIIIRKNKD